MRAHAGERFRAFHVSTGSIITGVVKNVYGPYANTFEVQADGIPVTFKIDYPEWEIRSLDQPR